MTIRITNQHLPAICAFLTDVKLAGPASRARSRVLAMARAALEALAEAETELVTEHAHTDADGRPVISDEGAISFTSAEHAQAFTHARRTLMSERAELVGQAYEQMATTLHHALVSLETQLSGEEAEAYDHLCQALEHHLTEENTHEHQH